MRVFKRAWVGIVPVAVGVGMLAMPSSAGAQVDLYPLCVIPANPPGGQFINPVVLLAEETVGGACDNVAGEVYTVTSVVESELGSATGSG